MCCMHSEKRNVLSRSPKRKCCMKGHVNVKAVSSSSTGWRSRQHMPDCRMWSADVAVLSFDGWQLNEDAVVMQSRLETGVQCTARYCGAVFCPRGSCVCVCVCRRYVLGKSDSIDDLGTLRWQLVVSLLAAWIFIFLALCKGVKSSGKASNSNDNRCSAIVYKYRRQKPTVSG